MPTSRTMTDMHSERWRLIEELFHRTLERPPNERRDFLAAACEGDNSLRAEIEELLDANDQAGSFIKTPPALGDTTIVLTEPEADSARRPRLGAYEVIQEIGRGGMGTVYLAARADEEFRKRVAIKLVTAGFDHESIIQRFRNERQILASLDHPNIARLLDGGTTETGAPYFVMEYIEGQTIREYCDSRRLSTDDRLKLFRTVCSAVHFAHQNLIVHRDIKPGNILVTPDGTAKLLDFGVAKLLSPIAHAGEITETISRGMTPEYASPEQARGEAITTASDIYSLGVLLYELLTGHRPYSVSGRSLIEVIEAICKQEPTKPSTAVGRTETSPDAGGSNGVTITPEVVSKARDTEPQRLRRELEGDLDNIVLKAMRKEPQRRYASVEQFSEDINRYFHRLPVIARQDTLSYRTSKFMSRHKAGVAAAALVVIALLGGALATLWQAHVARRERDKAERRFNDVRKLANAVLFKYHDGIQNLPGSTPVREMLVKDAMEYLDSLSRESEGNVPLQRELAAGYRKLGDVQGDVINGNIGDSAGALQSYQRAIAILEAIAAADPRSLDDRKKLASVYLDLTSPLNSTGDRSAALEMARKAATIYEAIVADDPSNLASRNELARAYFNVASYSGGDHEIAIESYRKAITLYEQLASIEPGSTTYRRNLALGFKYLGGRLELTGDGPGALQVYQKAVALDEARAAADPNDAGAKLDLSFSYGSIGAYLTTVGELNGALDNYRKALALRIWVAEADPKNAFARIGVARAYNRIGDILAKMGDITASLENIRNALSLLEALTLADPNNTDVRNNIAETCNILGDAHAKLASTPGLSTNKQVENWRAAQRAFHRAREFWSELSQRGSMRTQFQNEPEILPAKIAKCEEALSKLKNK
ncbi:MAG TPA: serine/threonine-protein kinase [Blastocatellia bacterium]|nr:serine/threonine-protein kinase [Blastocatellia bacterium]